MNAIVLVCGRVFDGGSDTLSEKMEILVEKNRITSVGNRLSGPKARK